MKQTLVIFLAFFLSFGAVSASKGDKSKKIICGKVIDKITGEVLAGVKVEIRETGIYCYTDLNGNYLLALPNNSRQEVEANVAGYAPGRLKTTDLGFNVDIPLNPLQ